MTVQTLVDPATTWLSAGCSSGRPPAQTEAPCLSFLGGCSSGRALSDRISSTQMPGKSSFPLSVRTGTNFRTDVKIFHQPKALCCISLLDNSNQGSHLSISSLQPRLPSPSQRFLTPTSQSSLSERSSSLSLLEAELMTEARALELCAVRLQLLSLNEQKRK